MKKFLLIFILCCLTNVSYAYYDNPFLRDVAQTAIGSTNRNNNVYSNPLVFEQPQQNFSGNKQIRYVEQFSESMTNEFAKPYGGGGVEGAIRDLQQTIYMQRYR